MPAAPHARRVTEIPAQDRPRNTQGQDAAPDCRQLRHPQTSCGSGVVGKAPAVQHALHTHLGVVADMVERFFRDLTTERLRRGVFTSVAELTVAINEYVAHHNGNPKPFIRTKSARDISDRRERSCCACCAGCPPCPAPSAQRRRGEVVDLQAYGRQEVPLGVGLVHRRGRQEHDSARPLALVSLLKRRCQCRFRSKLGHQYGLSEAPAEVLDNRGRGA